MREGAHYVTAYRWFRDGKLPTPARRVSRLILVDSAATQPAPAGVTVEHLDKFASFGAANRARRAVDALSRDVS